MVIKIHESCCSIFNELCFSLHRLAARSLFIIPLYLLLVKRFFKLFSSFFARFLRNLAFSLASLRLAGCSLASPIVYHILRPLSSGFSKFFRDFYVFLTGRVVLTAFLMDGRGFRVFFAKCAYSPRRIFLLM